MGFPIQVRRHLYIELGPRIMKISWHGSTFCITGPLWGDSPVTHGFHSQRDSKCRAFMFSTSFAEQAVEQTVELLVIWDAMMLMWCLCNVIFIMYNEHVKRWHFVVTLVFWLDNDIDGLVQERRNSSALAMELRLSCSNPSICESMNLGVSCICENILQKIQHFCCKREILVTCILDIWIKCTLYRIMIEDLLHKFKFELLCDTLTYFGQTFHWYTQKMLLIAL